MDSMVNRYTADRRIRSDDAYTPHGVAGGRPDRCVLVYAQRVREAYKDVPLVIGGIEASLRRIAHFDYWSEKVRRSVLLDAKADLLVYGNAERQIGEIAHRLAAGTGHRRDPRTCAALPSSAAALPDGWTEIDSTTRRHARAHRPADRSRTRWKPGVLFPANDRQRDRPQRIGRRECPHPPPAGRPVLAARCRTPTARVASCACRPSSRWAATRCSTPTRRGSCTSSRTRAMRAPWCSGTATATSGSTRRRSRSRPRRWTPSTSCPTSACRTRCYGEAKIPAYEMIRFSIAIQRGCFGGCTFCSITEHEGRIIQNRSEDSVIREIETDPRHRAGLHRRHLRPGRTDGQHVPARLQVARDRVGLPPAIVRLSRHLPEPRHRPRAADQAVPPGARAARHQEGADRLRRALRPRHRVAGVRQGTRAAPCRRLSQDRARGASRTGPLVEDDEAGDRHLRPLQGPVRQVLEGSGQEAVPDPVLHRRPPRHDRPGHAGARALAEAQRLPRRPGAGLPALADGDGDGDVPLGQEPAAQGEPRLRGSGRSRRACACAGCTRPFCATTTRTTGRCCARHCAAWAART